MEKPPSHTPKKFKQTKAYEGYFDVDILHFELPSGSTHIHSCATMPADAVMILAETQEQTLILTKEYRPCVDRWIYSCPGGCIDQGETPLEAARRELLEETGYGVDEIKILSSAYPFPGSSSQKIYFALGFNAIKIQEPKLDPSECIEVIPLSSTNIENAIERQEAIDGILCTALYLRSLQRR